MFVVYVLHSIKFDKIYIGFTSDLEKRLLSHNKLAGLKSYTRGLSMDIDAVENGIKMKWSNGAVEGHVNRIKSIKRQMF